MTDTAISYDYHPMPKRVRYIISVLCGFACLWVAFNARTPTLAIVSALFAIAALAAQLDQRVCIDTISREVSRQLSLWGLSLRSSHWSLGDFTGIGIYRINCGTPQASADLVHVGLRRSSGGLLVVRYFRARRGQPCPEADAFARSLEKTTHLKFHEVA